MYYTSIQCHPGAHKMTSGKSEYKTIQFKSFTCFMALIGAAKTTKLNRFIVGAQSTCGRNFVKVAKSQWRNGKPYSIPFFLNSNQLNIPKVFRFSFSILACRCGGVRRSTKRNVLFFPKAFTRLNHFQPEHYSLK